MASQLIHKLNINLKQKLLYNEEELFCTTTELLKFKITLSLAKLNMACSRLVTNGLIFSYDIPVNIRLIIFLLLPNISELTITGKTKKSWWPLLPVKYILPNKESYPFSDICANFGRLVSLFSAYACFVLFEVAFLFEFILFISRTKLGISASVAIFVCFNHVAKFSTVNLLNFCVVIYLLLWSWLVIIFGFH